MTQMQFVQSQNVSQLSHLGQKDRQKKDASAGFQINKSIFSSQKLRDFSVAFSFLDNGISKVSFFSKDLLKQYTKNIAETLRLLV